MVAGISEKNPRIAWGTDRESELMLSANVGMAAAVLSPCGVFIENKKKGGRH